MQITAQIFGRSPIVQCSCTLVTIQTWLPVAVPLSANPFSVPTRLYHGSSLQLFPEFGWQVFIFSKKIQFHSLKKMFSGKMSLKCSNNAQCFCFCLLKCLKNSSVRYKSLISAVWVGFRPCCSV